MVILWPNPDGSVILSQRQATGFIEPQPDASPPRLASLSQTPMTVCIVSGIEGWTTTNRHACSLIHALRQSCRLIYLPTMIPFRLLPGPFLLYFPAQTQTRLSYNTSMQVSYPWISQKNYLIHQPHPFHPVHLPQRLGHPATLIPHLNPVLSRITRSFSSPTACLFRSDSSSSYRSDRLSHAGEEYTPLIGSRVIGSQTWF